MGLSFPPFPSFFLRSISPPIFTFARRALTHYFPPHAQRCAFEYYNKRMLRCTNANSSHVQISPPSEKRQRGTLTLCVFSLPLPCPGWLHAPCVPQFSCAIVRGVVFAVHTARLRLRLRRGFRRGHVDGPGRRREEERTLR